MNHDAQTYARYRPLYPTEFFKGLLLKVGHTNPHHLRMLDVGCGAGQSVQSLSNALSIGFPKNHSWRLAACDPDPAMIAAARSSLGELADWTVAPAEKLPFSDGSFQAISLLSAYHWFDREQADLELLRVLGRGGCILIGEYQFPKTQHQPDFDEWIRRNFNLHWKLPEQKPRGRLRDLTRNLTGNAEVQGVIWSKLETEQHLTASDFTGLLVSQARYIAYLKTLPSEKARADYLIETQNHIHATLGDGETPFRFRFESVVLSKA